ncbi:cytochrome c3 family protein [Trichlorobacter ammonificans]|uniref:MULTIHEME_CYTC domain-containing protein n=1 Tax=Trichlorobacter ammonificans TaxID=2916410 RepID=A0ABM9D9R6_9BACT|nr:cytochrome c3 family protein [Trichlorobacter ammonificans]CAH2031489.1 MULTIHEME_CYTC domain-containing protein [Trichlorobacter ammonificans]
MRRLLFPLLLVLTVVPATATAFECTVCHSKNPAMVKMHAAARGQGCFGCHRVGERLMGKKQPKDRESLLARRQIDTTCLPCHGTPPAR